MRSDVRERSTNTHGANPLRARSSRARLVTAGLACAVLAASAAGSFATSRLSAPAFARSPASSPSSSRASAPSGVREPIGRPSPQPVLAKDERGFTSDTPQPSADPKLSRTVQRLVELCASRANDVAGIELELASLGRDAVGALVDAGATRVVRIPRADRAPLELPLPAPVLESLPGALARSPASVVVRELERVIDARSSEPARVFALDVLARCGGSRDLDLARRLAGDGAAPALSDAFLRALAGILTRTPAAHARLADLHASLPPPLTQALARAIASLPPLDALPLLAHLVHARRGDEPALLVEIARLGRASDACETDDVRSAVRTLVADADARIAEGAVRAASALGDVEGVPEIAGLLGSFDRSARDAAHEALVELVGFDLGREPHAWRAWHAGELHYWQVESAGAEADLARGSAVAAARAVRELARHAAFPHEAARILELGLARPEAEIAALACAALGRMRCGRARAALEDALEQGTPSVREIARAALAQRDENAARGARRAH